MPRSTSTLLRSPACWTMPVTTSPTRSMYSSYIISRSASRIRCRITCLAVCAAMRPKLSGVTSSRFISSSGTCDQSTSRSSSLRSVWFFSLRLLLDPLELVERALARLVEQPALEVGGKLDREDAVVARVVELDRRMPRGARRLLVGRKEGVLERREQRFRVDALLALDLPNRLNDLLAHHAPTLRRSDWPARSRRTVCRPARRSRSQAGTTARPPRRPRRGACGRRS